MKAEQVDLDATNAAVATKASQADLNATNAALAQKADQSALDAESARLDQTATQVAANTTSIQALDARVTTNAAAIMTTQSALNSTDEALAALTVEVAALDALTAGTVPDGFPMLQGGIVRAIKGISPIGVAVDVNHVEVFLDQTQLASTAALAALEAEVDGKQDMLTAGTGAQAHEKLLEATTIKSLVAGENVTLSSTGEFVSISAGGAVSADGPAGTYPLVNAEGEILRLRPGAGLYAMDQGALGSVEIGMITQGVLLEAPFAVKDGAAYKATFGSTRADLYTDL
jgi:hypothetical protein